MLLILILCLFDGVESYDLRLGIANEYNVPPLNISPPKMSRDVYEVSMQDLRSDIAGMNDINIR